MNDDGRYRTDKRGQLAAAVVTHFDYEVGRRTTYIIEITDPDAEVDGRPGAGDHHG